MIFKNIVLFENSFLIISLWSGYKWLSALHSYNSIISEAENKFDMTTWKRIFAMKYNPHKVEAPTHFEEILIDWDEYID